MPSNAVTLAYYLQHGSLCYREHNISCYSTHGQKLKTGVLWMQYFSAKDTISAVIPGGIFEVMFMRAESCPMFLYALPQKEGFEFFLGQWSGLELHFTSLINVQTVGEHAPSQLILYHYSDLQKGKGIVLMTAEMDPKFISVHQAQCLANQVQLFYGTQRLETFQLVETFNHKPADFKHMSVIAELEQSGVGPGFSPALSLASKESGHQEPCSNTQL